MCCEQGNPAPTHDLIRLRQPIALTVDAPVPSWVAQALRRTPWVVVRRGYVRDGMLPVGVCGAARHQRYAAFVAVAGIAERRSPEDLTDPRCAIERRRDEVPALAALARVAPVLESGGHRWGPRGSVGFEIATGAPTSVPSSDLDLILRQDRRLRPAEAIDLRAALIRAAAPTPVDVMLETPCGGVLLDDLALRPSCVLVRTREGTCLAADPWTVGGSAFHIRG
jgi:phosphoribosyl-dephospho-CoA transferase